jgi:hypothetical protein
VRRNNSYSALRHIELRVSCVAQPIQKLRWIERGRVAMEFSVAGVGIEVGIVARGELEPLQESRGPDPETLMIGLWSRR